MEKAMLRWRDRRIHISAIAARRAKDLKRRWDYSLLAGAELLAIRAENVVDDRH